MKSVLVPLQKATLGFVMKTVTLTRSFRIVAGLHEKCTKSALTILHRN